MARTSLALVAILLAAGCSRPTPQPAAPVVVAPPEEVDDGSIPPPRPFATRPHSEALAAGVAFLLKQQSDDGAWRSDVTASFADGTALTPLVVCALQDALDADDANPAVPAAIQKGCNFLMTFVKATGIDPGRDGFEHPVYTAALALRAFSHRSAREFSAARGPWVKYLKERQLTESLGWKPDEKPFGGWGYCQVIPRKPEPNTFAPPLVESNLSATTFALEALRVAGQLDPDTSKLAATFVRRCQNDDGGFHFTYDDPVRNKAGVVNPADKPLVFYSYGSTTADGLRALRYGNLPADGGRLKSAAEWLANHFHPDTHPGTFAKGHEWNRQAAYYYYAASVAKALRGSGAEKAGGVDWATALSAALALRQKRDGSWANPLEAVREHDPLVATANAVSALASCKPPKPAR